jgi:pimeloyl-ACP methyl ester carboxylesterase
MDKNKMTIIFLHGALGTSKDLVGLMEPLQEKNYNTLTFDFSGHGTVAKWPEEFRIDLFARDLDKFIKDHKLQDVIVFGYSMGGYVGLYHHANYPDSPIKQIITYGTKFNWSENAVARELPMLDPEHLREKFPSFADSLQTKHGDRWKALLRSTAHMMQNLEKLDGLTREDLAEVIIPVTFILGDQDRMVSSEETHLTASWLRRGQVKTLTHSKHELERSNLRELSNIIAEIIE